MPALRLTSAELVELRAAQRTFEGAYMRTALGQFGFALLVLKLFTGEFYSIGALFAVYGAGIMGVGALRRSEGRWDGNVPCTQPTSGPGLTRGGTAGNRQFFAEVGEDGRCRSKFRTSGNVVVVLTGLSVSAYVCLLVLTLRLER